MKWFKTKYTYVLIVLSLLVSSGLQVAWLRQLFLAQQEQLKEDIEHFVSTTAQTNMYYSITSFEKPGNLRQIKQLFLSPQWEQLRRAFDNMKMDNLSSNASITIDNDSTSVSMNFSLKDTPAKRKHRRPVVTDTGMTPEQLEISDSLSLVELKKKVATGLREIGITSPIYHNIYVYNKSEVFKSNVPKGLNPVFTSSKYLYNIQNIYPGTTGN